MDTMKIIGLKPERMTLIINSVAHDYSYIAYASHAYILRYAQRHDLSMDADRYGVWFAEPSAIRALHAHCAENDILFRRRIETSECPELTEHPDYPGSDECGRQEACE